MRRPTSHDVARLAGVTQPTVSRALRDDPRVSEETRRRVREAAAQLSYVPSRRGQSLSTQTTGQVALVVGDLGNPFYMEAVEHLHAAFGEHGRQVVVLTEPPDRPMRADALLDGSVDGAILTTTTLGSRLPGDLAARGLPVALFNRALDGETEGVDVCASDNATAARAVAAEIAGLGHTRVAAILGPAETSTGRDRGAGFRAGLAAAGLSLPAARERRGAFAYDTGHEHLRSLWSARERPTALFCANDVIALGALSAAHALGIAVPGELTVIGFDDIQMAGWDVFGLTTVRQDLRAMARLTAELLLDRIADPQRPARRRTVPTAIVHRGSHGPPPGP